MRKASLGITVLLGAVLACTAVVSEDPVQCSTEADCTARGPDFKDTTCSGDGLCVPKPPPPPECSKSSDCKAKGEDFICSSTQNRCVSLTESECTVAYGDPKADGTVLFGLLSEIGRDDTLYFRQQPHLSAAKLAFAEFFDKQGVRFEGGRSAALIACSEHFPRRVSAFLANLGVKAVIGPTTEDRQKAVVETLVQGRIPSFSPWINGNPSSVVPATAGFAWLAGFKRPDVVDPLNALMAEQESRLKLAQPAITNVRVAVVINTPTTPGFNAFAEYGDLMDQRLFFNGKTAVENERDAACVGGCYKRFATSQAERTIVEQRAKDIIAFNPHFIVPFADIDWGAQLLPKLEELYKTAPPTTFKPIYLQTFLQIEDGGYKTLPVADAEVRKRITGIRPVRDNSFEVFQNKYREAYRPNPTEFGPEPNPGGGRAFETALLVLFSTYAALAKNPNAMSEDIVDSLGDVTDKASGTKITLNDIATGIARLNAKAHIDLDGLFTTFDFDLQTNSAPPQWTTWCVGPAGQYVSTAGRVFANGTFGAPEVCQ